PVDDTLRNALEVWCVGGPLRTSYARHVTEVVTRLARRVGGIAHRARGGRAGAPGVPSPAIGMLVADPAAAAPTSTDSHESPLGAPFDARRRSGGSSQKIESCSHARRSRVHRSGARYGVHS